MGCQTMAGFARVTRILDNVLRKKTGRTRGGECCHPTKRENAAGGCTKHTMCSLGQQERTAKYIAASGTPPHPAFASLTSALSRTG